MCKGPVSVEIKSLDFAIILADCFKLVLPHKLIILCLKCLGKACLNFSTILESPDPPTKMTGKSQLFSIESVNSTQCFKGYLVSTL